MVEASAASGMRVQSSFSATLVKKSKHFHKLGLLFGTKPAEAASEDANSYIVFLAKVSGAFQKKTHLVPGLQVLSINQTLVKTTEEAILACESVQVGHILSIQVVGSLHKATKKQTKKKKHSFFSFALKPASEEAEKVGISIKAVLAVASPTIVGDAEEEQTQIKITHVDEDGLFPDLKTGSILLAVNGKLANSFQKTLTWLTTSKTLTLIVLDPPKTPQQLLLLLQPTTSTTTTTLDAPGLSPSPKWKTNTNTAPALPLLPSRPEPEPVSASRKSNTLPVTTKIHHHHHHHQDEEASGCKLRVVACIMRPSLQTPLGLTFRQEEGEENGENGGGVIIHSVAPNGIFAHTGIQPNQKIVKINGHVCKQIALHKFDHAVDLLLQATGRVTLEAETTTAVSNKTMVRQIFSIQKAKKSLQLGLGLEVKQGMVHITKVSPTLEKVLGLKQGLQLQRVNGKACNGNHIKSVHDQMDQAFPMLSLECLQTIHHAATATATTTTNVRVVACVIRPDASVGLGLTFRQDIENGWLIVDTVASKGIFAHTGVRPKQKIVKINGHGYTRISQLKLDQAVTLLQQSMGRLTVEAESIVPHNSNQQQQQQTIQTHIISIQKAKKSFQLGLGLQQIHTPTSTLIKISKVSPTLEKVLGLKEGLRLLRINGVPCDADNIPSVHAQMDLAFPMLSMECTLASEPTNTTTPMSTAPRAPVNVNANPDVVEEKGDDDDDDSWLSHENEIAEKALPIRVNASNKTTAKIVRTVTVELPKNRLQYHSKASLDSDFGLTLAKHKHLNAIVIADISSESLMRKKLTAGQVMVSINHISCPLTTDSTMKMLRRKAREGPSLRIEAGDVEHVVDSHGFGHKQPSSSHLMESSGTDEEAEMIKAIQMGMLKATDELKEEYDFDGAVISDDMELDDVLPANTIQMVGLPAELLPPKKKENPVYYEDENPDVISA